MKKTTTYAFVGPEMPPRGTGYTVLYLDGGADLVMRRHDEITVNPDGSLEVTVNGATRHEERHLTPQGKDDLERFVREKLVEITARGVASPPAPEP